MNTTFFNELSYEEIITIDGGKSGWAWLGDICVAVGTVVCVGSGVGVPIAATFAGVSYIYALNRPQ